MLDLVDDRGNPLLEQPLRRRRRGRADLSSSATTRRSADSASVSTGSGGYALADEASQLDRRSPGRARASAAARGPSAISACVSGSEPGAGRR